MYHVSGNSSTYRVRFSLQLGRRMLQAKQESKPVQKHASIMERPHTSIVDMSHDREA